MTLKEITRGKINAWKSAAVDEDHLLYLNTGGLDDGKTLDLGEVKELRDVLNDFLLYQEQKVSNVADEIYEATRYELLAWLVDGTLTYNSKEN